MINLTHKNNKIIFVAEQESITYIGVFRSLSNSQNFIKHSFDTWQSSVNAYDMQMMVMINCFCGMVDRRKALSLFPSGTIVRDPNHRESPTRRMQGLNLRRTWVQTSWMKLCSNDNHLHYILQNKISCSKAWEKGLRLSGGDKTEDPLDFFFFFFVISFTQFTVGLLLNVQLI